MSKDSFWFRHDSNARNDPKLAKLLFVGGHAAKSCFWDLIEIMREADDYRIEKDDLEAISYQCRFPDGENVVQMMIDCELLLEDEKHIWSASLLRRMEKWDTKKELLRKAGKKGGKAKARNQKGKDDLATLKPGSSHPKATLKPPSSQALAIREEKIREEKIREEKIREEDKTGEKKTRIATRETKTNTEQEFDRFWSAYPRKVGKKKAEKAFGIARKDKNWKGIDPAVEAIERQKKSQQWKRDGGQYIPHPTTWLNAGSWDDDVSRKTKGGTFMENLRKAAKAEREGKGAIDVEFERH